MIQLHRLAERGKYDKETVHAVFDEALFCTVSYVDGEGNPVTIPTNFVRIGDAIIVHGKSSAAMVRALASGARVCITATLVRCFLPAHSSGPSCVPVTCLVGLWIQMCVNSSMRWCWRAQRSITP